MPTSFSIRDEDFVLLPEKAMLWKDRNCILVADPHFGKITHFRKSGIAIPDGAALRNLQKFDALIRQYQPERVLFLGDLFHSELNTEWFAFKELLARHPDVHFELVIGNHDILHRQSYLNCKLKLHEQPLVEGNLILSHEPLEPSESYNLCGHIHPGVMMRGNARQSMRLPCFFFGKHTGILPAFGEFTGLHLLQPKKGDEVFLIAGDQVIKAS